VPDADILDSGDMDNDRRPISHDNGLGGNGFESRQCRRDLRPSTNTPLTAQTLRNNAIGSNCSAGAERVHGARGLESIVSLAVQRQAVVEGGVFDLQEDVVRLFHIAKVPRGTAGSGAACCRGALLLSWFAFRGRCCLLGDGAVCNSNTAGQKLR